MIVLRGQGIKAYTAWRLMSARAVAGPVFQAKLIVPDRLPPVIVVEQRTLNRVQAPPEDGVRALLDGAAGTAPGSQAAVQGVSPLALAHGAGMWAKADAYYFRTVARVQRLWQAGAQCACYILMQVMGAQQTLCDNVCSFLCAPKLMPT